MLPYKYTYVGLLLTEITATYDKVPLNYHRVRELYFLAVIFVATIYAPCKKAKQP